MYKYSSSDMFSSSSYHDENQLDLLVFSNPFIPFFTTTCSDPIDDIAQSEITNSNHHHHHHSSSPLDHPFSHLESQSSLLYQGNQDEEQPQPTYLSALEGSELKISSSEECQMGGLVDINTYNNHVDPHMQRSSSCNSFDANSYEAAPQHCDILMDSPNFHQWRATTLTSLQNSFFAGQGQLRRVFSAGDLQSRFETESRRLLEEANLNNNKVGRYSPEERKEKISKYRAKRSQRKFNKTIKYACRKTLADNRARIRGRFARNDLILPQCSTGDDEFWIDLIERLLNDEVLS